MNAGFPDELLPPGTRSRFVADVNGLRMHILEAGHEAAGRGFSGGAGRRAPGAVVDHGGAGRRGLHGAA